MGLGGSRWGKVGPGVVKWSEVGQGGAKWDFEAARWGFVGLCLVGGARCIRWG